MKTHLLFTVHVVLPAIVNPIYFPVSFCEYNKQKSSLSYLYVNGRQLKWVMFWIGNGSIRREEFSLAPLKWYIGQPWCLKLVCVPCIKHIHWWHGYVDMKTLQLNQPSRLKRSSEWFWIGPLVLVVLRSEHCGHGILRPCSFWCLCIIFPGDVLLFFKLYDPKSRSISFCGHTYMPITEKLSSLVPLLCERAGFPQGTDLIMFEVIFMRPST